MEDNTGYLLAREHERFKAKQRALVLLPQKSKPLPFHIIDISEGGLSFTYLGERIDLKGNYSVSLYDDQEMIVGDLPVKAVSNIRLSNVLVPVNRGSLCFEALDLNQRRSLSTFIKTCTVLRH